jgi:Tol biopolymer transport system component
MMKGKIGFVGLIAIMGLLAIVLFSSIPGWAQKVTGKPVKPPNPPPTPADPAIAYIANVYKGASIAKTVGRLMVMNADGSNQRVVISETGFEYGAPDWSPDGTQLVFTRYYIPGRDTGIYVVNVDGTGLREVFNCGQGGLEGPVTWSPMPLADDFYKIAFCYSSERRPDGTYEIDHDAFLINLDGTGLVRLTNTQGVGEGNISWSPTADRVTFPASDPETGAGGFVVCQINYIEGTFSLTPLASCFEFGWGIWANLHEELAVSKLDARGVNDIWIYDLANPSLSYPLTSTPNYYEHDQSWSPDDSKLLFVQAGQLYIANSDGSGGLTPICPGVDFSWRFPKWRRNL